MRGLADAAVEGLLVCDEQRIVTVNSSFLHLDRPAVRMRSRVAASTDFLTHAAYRALTGTPRRPVETEISDRLGIGCRSK